MDINYGVKYTTEGAAFTLGKAHLLVSENLGLTIALLIIPCVKKKGGGGETLKLAGAYFPVANNQELDFHISKVSFISIIYRP